MSRSKLYKYLGRTIAAGSISLLGACSTQTGLRVATDGTGIPPNGMKNFIVSNLQTAGLNASDVTHVDWEPVYFDDTEQDTLLGYTYRVVARGPSVYTGSFNENGGDFEVN